MDTPLSNVDIDRALRGTSGYRGCYSYDLLPTLKNGEFCVANTDNVIPRFDQPEAGHHWITLFRQRDSALVFDSFGRSLDGIEESYTEPYFKQYVLNALPHCTVYTNTQVLQHHDTAVCGHYAILVGRLFARSKSIETVLRELGRMFSNDTLANDKLVLTGAGEMRWTDALANELHKPRKVQFERRRVQVKHIDQIWSADLVDMHAFSRQNRGYKYILTIIDVFTKYAWVSPLKTKHGVVVRDAFQQILKRSRRVPSKLWVDRGGEFYNRVFQSFLKEKDIDMYSTHGEGKAVVIERFNRTLKGKMYRYFSANNTRKYLNVLPAMLEQYNHTKHRTIGMTPHDASFKENEERVKTRLTGKPKSIKQAKLKIGDHVRVSKIKRHFEKSYVPNWTEEVFVIHQVNATHPVTYKLIDLLEEPIKGSWYESQLQKTEQNTFRIEKVLRRKKGQVFVKWMGYPAKFNMWLPLNDLEKLK